MFPYRESKVLTQWSQQPVPTDLRRCRISPRKPGKNQKLIYITYVKKMNEDREKKKKAQNKNVRIQNEKDESISQVQ